MINASAHASVFDTLGVRIGSVDISKSILPRQIKWQSQGVNPMKRFKDGFVQDILSQFQRSSAFCKENKIKTVKSKWVKSVGSKIQANKSKPRGRYTGTTGDRHSQARNKQHSWQNQRAKPVHRTRC